MNQISRFLLSNMTSKRGSLIALLSFFLAVSIFAQVTEKIQPGSAITNVGVIPETLGNGLENHALVNTGCLAQQIINPCKSKGGANFACNATDYLGVAFVVEAQNSTSTVNSLITVSPNSAGHYKMVCLTTISLITIPVYLSFYNAPHWRMDLKSGSIATAFAPLPVRQHQFIEELYGKYLPGSIVATACFFCFMPTRYGQHIGICWNGIVSKAMEEQSLVSQVRDVVCLYRMTI